MISFGIFDVDRDDISSVRGEEQAELKRQDAMAAFTKNIPLEGDLRGDRGDQAVAAGPSGLDIP